jgi:hypothetical protein
MRSGESPGETPCHGCFWSNYLVALGGVAGFFAGVGFTMVDFFGAGFVGVAFAGVAAGVAFAGVAGGFIFAGIL